MSTLLKLAEGDLAVDCGQLGQTLEQPPEMLEQSREDPEQSFECFAQPSGHSEQSRE